MTYIEDFLTQNEEQEIIEAIRRAELKTSGEIRVHIEQKCDSDVLDHAKEVFHFLKMDNTKLQNGVLFYVALDNKQFAIYGDKGIHDHVGDRFWTLVKDAVAIQFQKGNYKQGLIDGINKAGVELAKFFPWIHGDSNELDNSISKG